MRCFHGKWPTLASVGELLVVSVYICKAFNFTSITLIMDSVLLVVTTHVELSSEFIKSGKMGYSSFLVPPYDSYRYSASITS